MSSQSTETGNTIERIGQRVAAIIERWMPSPFLFAIILTYLVYIIGILIEGTGPFEMALFWFDGFWIFLEFAMQMTLIIMTGFVIAYHPRVNAMLQWLTEQPNDGRQAVVLVGVMAMSLAWIHWGLGLIVGAIFAREMGKTAYQNGIAAHYPLLCLGGYMGAGLTWHWGLSGSAPLLINTPGNEFIELGIIDSTVSTTATIFHPYALLLTLSSIIFASIMLYLLAPSEENARDITEYVAEEQIFGETARTDGGSDIDSESDSDAERSADDGKPVPAERIDNSKILGGVIALTGVLLVSYTFIAEGLSALNLNVLNFGFLFIGVLMYTQPAVYRKRFGEAAEAAAGIILLFPFFAGIQGMMNSSGLSETLAEGILAVATPETFPILAWITAGVVNMFVPSGGGEWIVIGPAVLAAAQDLGVPIGQATIAYAVGDAHTNLFNPFWALPLLSITRIKARELFGYAITMLLLLIPFLAIALTVIPY